MDPTSRTGEPRKSRGFLIDDHPLVREGLVNLINSQRDLAVCGEAEDSAGAMTGMAKTRPDVALADISLKNESGLELVKNLESPFPLVALIALSMHDEALYAERALRAGALGYVMKNESARTVKSAIFKVLGGDIFLSEKMSSSVLAKLMRGKAEHPVSPVEQLSDRELEVFQMMGE